MKWKTNNICWLDADSMPISMSQILSTIGSKKAYEIHIGCDSHKRRNQYVFAIVIAAYIKNRGGIFFFHRKRSRDTCLSNLRTRLMKEVELAIKLAGEIQNHFPNKEITVHLDVNPKREYPSYIVLQNAVSWVRACGYEALVKPNAWASSDLADAFAK